MMETTQAAFVTGRLFGSKEAFKARLPRVIGYKPEYFAFPPLENGQIAFNNSSGASGYK